MVVFVQRLDLVILEFFPSLNDSRILFKTEAQQPSVGEDLLSAVEWFSVFYGSLFTYFNISFSQAAVFSPLYRCWLICESIWSWQKIYLRKFQLIPSSAHSRLFALISRTLHSVVDEDKSLKRVRLWQEMSSLQKCWIYWGVSKQTKFPWRLLIWHHKKLTKKRKSCFPSSVNFQIYIQEKCLWKTTIGIKIKILYLHIEYNNPK